MGPAQVPGVVQTRGPVPVYSDRDVYDAICQFHLVHRFAPSRRELQQACNMKAVNSINQALDRLAKLGVVSWQAGVPRSVTVVKPWPSDDSLD